jgi:predicted TIM-barrel fold metal-dependent hydrolase
MATLGIISTDGHVKASRAGYRDYISAQHLDAFDTWVTSMDGIPDSPNKSPQLPDESQWDSDLRLADVESQGVIAEVLFPNGLPFASLPFTEVSFAGDPALDREATRAYNRWLSDFCAEVPGRRAGMAVVSFNDIDAALEDIAWAKDHGLRGVMMPALNPGGTYFFDQKLDPVWACCQDLGLPLNQHGGAGLPAYEPLGFAALLTIGIESSFFAGRSMWQLIVGGVFERFPDLQYVLTETLVDWVPGMLRYIDGLVRNSDWMAFAQCIGREPTMNRLASEYWATNCHAAASPPAQVDFDKRFDLGLDTLMFGVDYPHFETIWPFTKETIQGTLGCLDATEDELRKILMENAADVFDFDLEALAPVVDRIGCEASELLTPRPEYVGGGGVGYHRGGHAALVTTEAGPVAASGTNGRGRP